VAGDIEANVRKMGDFAVRAKEAGADYVIFPEAADTGYSMRAIRQYATTFEEGAVPQLREIARTHAIGIISGVAEREEAAIYNSQVAIDRGGQIIATYRKSHLFSPAPIEEHKCFTPGDRLMSIELDGFQVGLTICYDLRFPEVYRTLACESGANVFLVSSAWPFPRVEHLRVLALARAIENQSYVVLANAVGIHDRITSCGSSAIIDAYGVTVASASADREELIVADISEEVVRSVRERMGVFAHRRTELYGKRCS
jgi:predicted amidohydrolase